MPRRELLRRSISLLPSLHQQTQQDDLQSGIRVLYGGEYFAANACFLSFSYYLIPFSFFRKECTGSICLAYGLESCQCIPGPNDPPTKACELCCRLPGENQPCLYVINYLSSCIYIYVFFFIAIKINVSMIDVARRSSFDWNSPPYDIPDMFSKPGTPCNDYNGYCDVFQKCREVSNICYLLL